MSCSPSLYTSQRAEHSSKMSLLHYEMPPFHRFLPFSTSGKIGHIVVSFRQSIGMSPPFSCFLPISPVLLPCLHRGTRLTAPSPFPEDSPCTATFACLPIQPLSHCDRAPFTLRFSRYCMVIQPLLQRNMTEFVMCWSSISCVVVKVTLDEIVCSVSTCRTVGRASKWSITRLQFPKGQGRQQTVPIVGADDSLRPYPHTLLTLLACCPTHWSWCPEWATGCAWCLPEG